MKRLTIHIVFVLVFLFAACVPAWAGWVLVEKGGEKSLISQGRIKAVPKDASEGWSVMDFKKGQILIVDLQKKTYAQASLDQFCTAMQKIVAHIRAMMGKAGQEKQKAKKVEIVKQGPGGKIAGFNTEKYKVLANGKLHEEVWLTTEPEFVKDFDPAMLNKMLGCATEQEDIESSPVYQKMVASGWLVRSIYYNNGNADTRTDVVKIAKQDVAESEFKVPQGYKKITVDKILMGQ